jgi:hypothetical protein
LTEWVYHTLSGAFLLHFFDSIKRSTVHTGRGSERVFQETGGEAGSVFRAGVFRMAVGSHIAGLVQTGKGFSLFLFF